MPSSPVQTPVFVLSVGRSGSNMLGDALACSSKLQAAHEPAPHLLDINYRAWHGNISHDEIQDALATRRDSLLARAEAAGQLYVESSHYLSFLVPALVERYNARFIHLIRDGRTFVPSAMQRGWYKWPKPLRWARLQLGQRMMLRPDPSVQWECHRLWPPAEATTQIQRLAWLWSEYNLGIRRQLQALNTPTLTVRLEDIGRDPKTELTRVLSFVGGGAIQDLDAIVAKAAAKPNRTEKSGQKPRGPLSEDELAQFLRWGNAALHSFGYQG